MKEKRFALLIASIGGIITGILSTIPSELNAWQSISFWAVAGVVIGMFAHGKKTVLWAGGLYGFFLTVSFLYSRFGGTWEHLFAYTLFTLVSSIGGILAGMLTVFIGSKLRAPARPHSQA